MTSVPQRFAAGMAVAAIALSATACSSPTCPSDWDGGIEHLDYCEPPSRIAGAAEERLGTGIYGYVVACTDRGNGDCSLDEAYSYSEASITLLPDLPEGGAGDAIEAPLGDGGTFEIELPPNVTIHPGNPLAATYIEGDEQEGNAFSLQEGEARFVLFKAVREP